MSPDRNQQTGLEHYRSLRRRIIFSIVLLLTVLVLLSIWHAYTGYQVAIRNAEQQSASYAHALKEHAERAISEVDHALDATSKLLNSTLNYRAPAQRALLISKLEQYTDNIPQVSAITVVGANGQVLATTIDYDGPLPNAAERGYFSWHRDHVDNTLLISPPIKSLVTGQWGFTLSRRLSTPTGNFNGVVLAFLDIRYFEQLYGKIVSGRNGRFTLATTAGDYLVLVPSEEKVYASGKKTAAFFRKYVEEQAVRTYHNKKSNIASQYRIVSYHRLDEYPVVAICSFGRDEAIRDWQSTTFKQGIIAGILCMLILLLTKILLNQIKQLDLTNQLLQQQQEELRRAKDAAEAATRTKSEFLANMSHEIRTPMNAIIGLTQLTLETELTQQQHGYLSRLKQASANLLGIISDILDFSRIEANRLELEAKEFSIVELVRQVADLFSTDAESKGLQIHLMLSDALPNRVIGDPLRLTQVLNNLVSNAVKFTHQGSVTLYAEISSQETEKLTVRFQVTDTGIGLHTHEIENLFRPFTQADNSISRRFGGTGLGLSIARKLVELMGGEITVSSAPDHGSSFAFTACFKLPENLQTEDTTEDQRTPYECAAPIHDCRILLVEDNPVNRYVAQEFLTKAGLEVISAEDGAVAVEVIHQQHFDAILMDMQMPVMDGLEATRKIRSMSDCGTIPIIAMTAAVSPDDREACLTAGMDDYITKPIAPMEMLQKLVAMIQVRQGDKHP